MIELTKFETEALKDICRGVNNRMHDKRLYEALEAYGLIAKCLGGYWAPTRAGRLYESARDCRQILYGFPKAT